MNKKHTWMVRLSSTLSVASALFIAAVKIFVWYKTQSLSILSGTIDAVLDISTSIINYVAIRFAYAPADDRHRFGHNKIEDLVVFGQSIFFLFSSIFAVILVIYKSWTGYIIENSDLGINFMIAVLAINLSLSLYQRYVSISTNSLIIRTDFIHSLMDLGSNFAIVVSLILNQYILIDVFLSLFIGIYIGIGSFKLIRESWSNLIDEELSDKDKLKIVKILKSCKSILGAHDLRTRKSGNKKFIQVHIELNKDLSLYEAHEITEKIVDNLKKCFIDSEIIIHQDPFGANEVQEFKIF